MSVPRSVLIGLGFGHVDALGLVVRRPPKPGELARAWQSLMEHRRGMQWGVGDVYNLVADGGASEDAVADALDLADISLATAQRYGHTCRRFLRCEDPSSDCWPLRRRNLSFSHHSAVAGLVGKSEAATALAVELLDKAEADRMTTAEDLEDAVRAFRSGGATAAGRAAEEGSPAARIERLHASGEKVLERLPADWHQERSLLIDALRLVESAYESARNREAGGLPADVLPVEEEVAA